MFKLFAGNAEMAATLGGAANVTMLGVVELAMVALFLYPRTGVVGALLMIAYMGGAMALHLTTGQSVVAQTIIQILVWLVSALRFPELRQRLFSGNIAAN